MLFVSRSVVVITLRVILCRKNFIIGNSLGPIVSGLVNRYEARPVMIAGAVFSSFAFFISYWAHSIFWLMLTFGIMGGLCKCSVALT